MFKRKDCYIVIEPYSDGYEQNSLFVINVYPELNLFNKEDIKCFMSVY